MLGGNNPVYVSIRNVIIRDQDSLGIEKSIYF